MERQRVGKDSQFWLAFPLADGNLREFWKKHHPTKNSRYPDWMAGQCHGLASALCLVHILHVSQTSSPNHSTPYYGIHGDIKPENLLWFGEWHNSPHRVDSITEAASSPKWAHILRHSTGSLASSVGSRARTSSPNRSKYQAKQQEQSNLIQLADFGISSFHTTTSRSNAKLGPHTKTYRAPEAELGQRISRSFDIWSLGCVFLEFASWLVLGTVSFSDERLKHGRGLDGISQDTFYTLVVEATSTTAKVNPAVIKVSKIALCLNLIHFRMRPLIFGPHSAAFC